MKLRQKIHTSRVFILELLDNHSGGYRYKYSYCNDYVSVTREQLADLIAGYTQGDFTPTIAYEPSRDLIAAVSNRFSTATISSFDYQNNAAGQRTQRIDNGAIINNFGYNIRQEVTSATMGADNYGYGYDTIGNRLWSSHNLVTNLYTANNLNQYTSISAPVREPLYDFDGNMVYDGAEWHYAWNGENRMICASNATHVVEYAYDHQGRMVWKRVSATDASTKTITYLWDDYNIIAEKVGRTVPGEPPIVATTFNIWGIDLSGTLQGAGGVGGLLAVVDGNSAFLPCYDANGNITEYLSDSGTIAAHYEYSPFGEITVQSGSLASTFTHRFSTKPWCAVAGLSEYEYRKYRPNIGRWLSRDPIGERGGVNLYVVVDNNAVNAYDFLGKMMMPVQKDTMIDVVGNAPNGDFIVKVVKATSENLWKREVGLNALKKVFASINCSFFQHGFRTGGTPLPRGAVDRYADLIQLGDEVHVPAAEFVRTGVFLAEALRSIKKEPYGFEKLLDAMYEFKADSRSLSTCIEFCAALRDYYALAGGVFESTLRYASDVYCVSECTDKCCTE